jgi:hypothetical protein
MGWWLELPAPEHYVPMHPLPEAGVKVILLRKIFIKKAKGAG